MDANDQVLNEAVQEYLEPEERLSCVIPAFTYLGFRRLVLGVTETRVIAVKTAFFTLRGKGLIWMDDRQAIALGRAVRTMKVYGADSGNRYVRVRRSDGRTQTLNVRRRIGFGRQSGPYVKLLFDLVPGRF